MCWSVSITVLSIRSLKNCMSSGHFSSTSREDALQQPFGQFHVAPQVAEGHFRLDHPELGQVAGRVAVLGAEGRAKGVGLAQPAGKRLGLELPADGQIGRAVEEVEREIEPEGSGIGDWGLEEGEGMGRGSWDFGILGF